MSDLHALTLWPEWAWAICALGKRVENRSERFARQIARRVGTGWLAIHAGKSIGGRPGRPATLEALEAITGMAQAEGWKTAHAGSYIDSDGRHHHSYATFRRGDVERALRPDMVDTSAIVAVCRVPGVLAPGLVSPWKVASSAALRLVDVHVLEEPVAMGGRQGLWAVPEAAMDRIAAQVPKVSDA